MVTVAQIVVKIIIIIYILIVYITYIIYLFHVIYIFIFIDFRFFFRFFKSIFQSKCLQLLEILLLIIALSLFNIIFYLYVILSDLSILYDLPLYSFAYKIHTVRPLCGCRQ